MANLIQSMTLSTTLMIIGVIWLCAWICWELIHKPLKGDNNNIMENLRKMEQKDIMDQRDKKR
jgi:hypothetical protein|tara:strand:- start:584 stop:772 length:189 start_codon:yes stop_codon:yes gene_type:complete